MGSLVQLEPHIVTQPSPATAIPSGFSVLHLGPFLLRFQTKVARMTGSHSRVSRIKAGRTLWTQAGLINLDFLPRPQLLCKRPLAKAARIECVAKRPGDPGGESTNVTEHVRLVPKLVPKRGGWRWSLLGPPGFPISPLEGAICCCCTHL